ncbi:hypothetical protein WS55_28845 [Burkholderia pseudomultivorans]|nr:hypothetical protein WS56_05345 [Burkholderia pseudomultivorans]KVC37731.1 hypothetical protein WS55_28845 [Burkholderia pseudomultivorans]
MRAACAAAVRLPAVRAVRPRHARIASHRIETFPPLFVDQRARAEATPARNAARTRDHDLRLVLRARRTLLLIV